MLGKTIQVPHEWDIYDIDNELRQCKQQTESAEHGQDVALIYGQVSYVIF